ncbi:YidB family protein [Actinobacillus equuli subsp. haemolyticus]|uniref:YidB family protein n=1 Tax=Actinobacillus equuli TaxID=718 RepID=UPI002442C602|nr:YidB family protein [Actinobacillus equuli]WGE80588.1 YidB family protein [Actinobacillus equuli subsp. haemolyticus]
MLGNILGSIASSVLSGGNGNQSTALQLIQALLQSQGGVEGIIAKLQQGGLDDLLKTWISADEENAPVSGEQIANVFGQENLQAAAQEAGVEEKDASDLLAEFLPKIVDTLTPDGQLPDLQNLNTNDLLAQAAKGVLGKLFS